MIQKLCLHLSLLCLATLGSVHIAKASCGIAHCSLIKTAQSDEKSWSAFNLFRATDFRDDHVLYLENFVGVGFSPMQSLNLMVLSPLVYIAGEPLGLGNTVLQADYQWISTSWGIGSGLQVELPTATESMYGDAHSVALPYVRGWFKLESLLGRAQVGLSQTLEFGAHSHADLSSTGHSGGHHHDHSHEHDNDAPLKSPLLINPHESTEILFRAQLQWSPPLFNQWVEILVGTDGVQEFTGSELTQVNGLIGVQSNLSWSRLMVIGLYPLTQEKRFNSRLMISLAIPIGEASLQSQTGAFQNPL